MPHSIPPGAYVEVGIEIVDEGKFIEQINRAMRDALRQLANYERETGDRAGCSKVTVVLGFRRAKGTDGFFEIKTKIATSVPQPQKASYAIERGGKLLCQPVGTNDDPGQQCFFDSTGRIIGEDGRPQVIDQPPVIGRIASQG